MVVVADPATISNGHVVLNGVKREHEHEVVMTLAGLFKARNIMPVYICMCRMVQVVDILILQGDNSGLLQVFLHEIMSCILVQVR